MVGAMWKVIVSLVLLMPGPCDGLFRSLYRSVSMPPKGDSGQPLFLTPYIEAGKIQKGRELSLVGPFPGLNMKSYAGYLTVNKTYNSNLFFWFFPAQIQPEDAPVVLWLQGGPGGSSMFGLFVEHGPYVVTSNMTLRDRDFPWTTMLSMLYIDNPVGTGFSFTDDTHGYAVNEDNVARDLYSALIQFFQIFPEYKNNDFYVTGESYAGKYVPAIAHLIHSLNPVREVKINLKGIAIGDGYSDPESIIGGYAEFLYQIGLLDEKQKKYFHKQCRECIEHIRKQNWFEAFEVLIYNGQLDIIVAAALTERSLMGMDWKGSQEYKKAEKKVWKIFKSDNEVAGYIRQVGDFHQVIIRGGGHILPYDQPLRAFDMINRFIYGKGWDPYVG
nr:probable serine carboxypeptidase CPVL isoform X4 [Pan troglodytes]